MTSFVDAAIPGFAGLLLSVWPRVLLFGSRVIHEPGLDVPHPRMHERAFVLVPLVEVDPDVIVPGHGPAVQLLARVAGQDVTRFNAE